MKPTETKEAAMTQKTQKVLRRALRVLQIAEHLEATQAPQIDRLKFWYVHGDNAIVNLERALAECETTHIERSLPGQPMNQAVMDEIVDYAHTMYLNGHYQNFDEALIRETELEHGIGDRDD
jgi:tRNA G37 N-methylase TrmD